MKKHLLVSIIMVGFLTTLKAQSPLCSSSPSTFCCEYVSSVTINGITRAGAPDATGFTSGPGYFDYTGSSITNLTAGQTYPVSVTVRTNSSYQEYVKIWFDFNGNGVLSDAGELVFNQVNTFNGTYVYSGNVTVPSTAFNGEVYIRVVMVYANSPALCGSYAYGTTLDFKATISGGLTSRNLHVTTTASGGFNGNVTSNPSGISTSSSLNSANFPNGSNVILTATANAGGAFINWSGDVSGSTNPLTVTLNSDMNITANFGPPYFVPTLSTASASSVTTGSASSGGTITSDGNQPVTSRGVCWNTSANPTTSNSFTTDGTGTGSFTSSLTSLAPGTLYYVRAYAINSIGTGYGNQINFATIPSDPASASASVSTIIVGSSTELTAAGAQGTVQWYTGSCGGTLAGSGNPIIVSPTVTTTYYARNYANNIYSSGCASVTITVNKNDQTITFDPIAGMTYGDPDFSPASASSGLPITYSSSNTSVATIVAGKVHISGVGSTDITASQPGNLTYNPAISAIQTLTVSKASLTVTANNKMKTYGATDPVLDYSATGTLYNGDAYSVITGVTLNTATGVTATNGAHTITASGGTALNYNITHTDGILTVSKASLTVAANDKAKIYGATDPDLDYTPSGSLFYTDTYSVISGVSLVAATGASASSGTHTITASGGSADNYDVTHVNGTLTVSKAAALTVTANDKSKVYGAADPVPDYTPSGILYYTDTYSVISGVSLTTATGAAASSGTHTITASGGSAENYDVNHVDGTLTVTKAAALTVTANDKSKVYGDADPVLDYTSAGTLYYTDTYSVISAVSLITETGASATFGTHTINASGGTADNYDVNHVNGTLTVSKAAPLTVTADDKSKVYGAADPVLSYTPSGTLYYTDTYSVISGVSLTMPTGASASSGTHTITAAGGSAGNYDVNHTNGTLTVSKASLTVTASDKSKVYGAADPVLDYISSGTLFYSDAYSVISGVSLTTSTGASASSGTHTITATGGTADNYDVNHVDGTLTVTKAAALTVTANDKSKVYGEVDPVFDHTPSGTLYYSDTYSVISGVSLVAATGASASSGTHSITAAGGSADNYDVNHVNGTLTVSKAAALTVTANDKSKVYGAADPVPDYIPSGILYYTDTYSVISGVSLTTATGAAASSGTHTITASGGSAENYDVNHVDGTLTVTKAAALTVTANDKSKVYGDADPVLDYTSAGTLYYTDTYSVISAVSLITETGASATFGTHTINASGGTADNYDVNHVNGTLTVSKAAPLTVTADDKSKVYGAADPVLSYTPSGTLYYTDTYSVISGVSLTMPTGASASSGTHTITAAGGSAGNYDVNHTNGTLTVSKASLTVTASDKSKVYGAADPVLDYISSGTLFYSDAYSVISGVSLTTSTGASASSGTHTITATGGTADNYDVNHVDGTLTVTKAAALTVTANDKSKVYGEVDPVFDHTPSGILYYSDTYSVISGVSLVAATGASASSGTHTITAAGGSADNYDVNHVNGTLTVSKAILRAIADNKKRTYGETDPLFTITYDSFRYTDNTDSLIILPSASASVSPTSNAGNYAITMTTGFDNNYDIVNTDGELIIEKALLKVAAGNKSRTYGNVNPLLTVSYSGFVNGDGIEDLDALPAAYTSADPVSDAGQYDIIAEGGADNNYSFEYSKGILEILKADQELTFDPIPAGLRTTQQHELVASSTSGLPVRFESSEISIAEISGKILSVIKEGTVTIKASQEGNLNWNPAVDMTQTIVTLPTFDNLRSLLTPNNDGMNDYWYIPDIEQYGTFSVQIYNRFGKLLYQSSAYKNDWEGTYNGSPLPEASYYFIIKSSEKGIIKGVVNLVR
jgi:gliding motility-associated-like protein